MALNRQTFITRTISALLFAVIMLGGILWNKWSFFILFSVIHFGCWIEYQRLIMLIDPEYKKITGIHKYGVMMAGWCLMMWFCTDDFLIGGFRIHEMGWWLGLTFLFLLPLSEILISSHLRLKNIGWSLLGLIYISLSWGLMIDLYGIKDLRIADTIYILKPYHIPLFIIFSIWINDTMAYIVGSLIGKTPLSKISPKKTWEGTIGGIILTMIVAGIIAYDFNFHIVLFVITAAVSAIGGTFGDLWQSKLKRKAGVKDSGHLMPGHGGFLDRFDSLLFAIPCVWLLVMLILY